MRFLAIALTALALVSCSRDPNVLKQKYLQSGNKYFDKGKYKEASIMYRKAIEKDRRFGPAYYHLALTTLKQGQVVTAVPALRRAVELLPPGTPEADDADLKLAEIIIAAAQSSDRNDAMVEEATQISEGLVSRNPNSWQGHKLSGDLAMLRATQQFRRNSGPEAKKELETAVAEYRSAFAAKPQDPMLALSLARSLVADGEIPEGEKLLKSVLGRDKKNLSAYVELYRIYFAQRKFPEAEAILKAAISENPQNGDIRLALASFYFNTNKRAELTSLLDSMKRDLKQFPNAYLSAGDFFLRVGLFDDAIKQYEEGIQKDPAKKADYRKHEIEAYVRQGRFGQAYEKAGEILKDDPKDPEARGLKATFLLDKGDINQAFQELQSVVVAKPSNFVARFNLGRAHVARGEYEQAAQEFDKAIEIRPDYMPARVAQTQLALVRGDNEAALRDADAILRVAPANIQGHVLKIEALQKLRRFPEARALLESALQRDPKQPDLLLELGMLDLNEKKNKEAEDAFRRAWEANPNNLRALVGQSEALFQQGAREKAVQVVAAEAQKNPGRLELQRELGNVQLRAGQLDAALATFQGVLPKTGDSRQQGELWTRIGEAYARKGDVEKSIEAMHKAQQLMPNNATIAANLAMMLDGAGKRDDARKYYEMTIKNDPNNPVALNNLAFLIAETNGDLNQALTYATRAKQKLPNFPEVSDTLGWIYLKKNLTDSAIDTFRTLVTQAPQNPTYHYHYAMALAQKGDRESARKECEAALAQKPNKQQEDRIRELLTKVG